MATDNRSSRWRSGGLCDPAAGGRQVSKVKDVGFLLSKRHSGAATSAVLSSPAAFAQAPVGLTASTVFS